MVLLFKVVVLILLGQVSNGVWAQASESVENSLLIEFPAISEMSGLEKSQQFDDVYWVHNDSGDEPRLFALDSQGKVIIPPFIQGNFHGEDVEEGKRPWPGLAVEVAANIDWEDIALSDGMLYIADMGNNGNARRDLGIYVVSEPNPRAVLRTRPFQFIPVRYPDQASFPPEQWTFDSESIFVHEESIYIVTKHRGKGIFELAPGANLYRLRDWRTDQINVLEKVDSHDDMFFVTASDLSPTGETLAVLGYTELWLFSEPDEEGKWLSGDVRRLRLDLPTTGIVEAITWIDEETLLLGSEEGFWFQIKVAGIPAYDGISKWEEGRDQIRRRIPLYQ